MNDGKGNLEELANIEKNNEAIKPLCPQAIVCIGEYPIKTILKQPSIYRSTLPMFIEKSSGDIYKWIPTGFEHSIVLGFETESIDTHFWFNVLSTISKNESLMDAAKKHSIKNTIIFASIWDGVGSASLPTLISKFTASGIDSLSIAILPSKIQPTDAHFNAYAAVQLCCATHGATVLLVDRDHLESYEGVDRKGAIIKGNLVSNYLLELLVGKDLLVEEISELARSFNVKLFTPLIVTGASVKIYGSLENMLNAALLKPLLTFDLSSASLLYVLIRMPSHLAEKLSRTKIELVVTNWFKEKTTLQSIHVTEPIYTQELNDRIDAVLFIGGFDTARMFADYETKVKSLKRKAVESGFITDNWQTAVKKEPEIEVKIKLSNKQELPAIPKTERAQQPTEDIKPQKKQPPFLPPEPVIENIEQSNLENQKVSQKPAHSLTKKRPRKIAKKKKTE